MKLASGVVNGAFFFYGERQVRVIMRVLGIVDRIEQVFNIEGDDGDGLSDGGERESMTAKNNTFIGQFPPRTSCS